VHGYGWRNKSWQQAIRTDHRATSGWHHQPQLWPDSGRGEVRISTMLGHRAEKILSCTTRNSTYGSKERSFPISIVPVISKVHKSRCLRTFCDMTYARQALEITYRRCFHFSKDSSMVLPRTAPHQVQNSKIQIIFMPKRFRYRISSPPKSQPLHCGLEEARIWGLVGACRRTELEWTGSISPIKKIFFGEKYKYC
jgi:hypothetical protein